jgi:hypothetical protein
MNQIIRSLKNAEPVGIVDETGFYKLQKIRLFSLGKNVLKMKHRGIEIGLDLREYFIDLSGNLYSINDDTWTTKYGINLLRLSDDSVNRKGQVVNSLRDVFGVKFTPRRGALYGKLMEGALEEVTDIIGIAQEVREMKEFLKETLKTQAGVA